MSTNVSKPFQLTIQPEPTFQGLTWEVYLQFPPGFFDGGSFVASGANEIFSAVSACPTNPSSVYYVLRLTGGSVVLPPFAQARNCLFHIDVAITGNSAQSFVNSLVYGDLGGVVFTASSPTLGYLNGSFDFPFVIPAAATVPQRTLTVVLKQVAQFLNGPPTPCSLDWSGSLYVTSYS
jgi:hypothetical protein